MSKILAFTNQKGGVGKTTSAVNVALSLAVSEVKTLLIDLDPQSNATTGLSELFGDLNGNIYDIMLNGDGAKNVITKRKNHILVVLIPERLISSIFKFF